MYLGPPASSNSSLQTTLDGYTQLCSIYEARHSAFGEKAGPVIIIVRHDVSSICASLCLLELLKHDKIQANILPMFDSMVHRSLLTFMTEYFEGGEPGKTKVLRSTMKSTNLWI